MQNKTSLISLVHLFICLYVTIILAVDKGTVNETVTVSTILALATRLSVLMDQANSLNRASCRIHSGPTNA